MVRWETNETKIKKNTFIPVKRFYISFWVFHRSAVVGTLLFGSDLKYINLELSIHFDAGNAAVSNIIYSNIQSCVIVTDTVIMSNAVRDVEICFCT